MVLAMVQLSRLTIYRLLKAGKFPQPMRLTPTGKMLFKRSEVEAWCASRGAMNEATAAPLETAVMPAVDRVAVA
jgi:predicted DNA-binding transcriptional regulator AlpA